MEIQWEGGSDNITLEKMGESTYRNVFDLPAGKISCRIYAVDGSENIAYSDVFEIESPPGEFDYSWIIISLTMAAILILLGVSGLLLLIIRKRRERESTPEEIRTLKSIFNSFGISASREETDCYEILGVKKRASEKEIRRSYRRLAGIRHPDRLGNGEVRSEEMVRLNCAKEILLDKEKRRIHDLYLRER
jgi:hypothetical protein